ncbi:hypothetical protein OSTOST_26223 [Ostertagia ostertagi]
MPGTTPLIPVTLRIQHHRRRLLYPVLSCIRLRIPLQKRLNMRSRRLTSCRVLLHKRPPNYQPMLVKSKAQQSSAKQAASAASQKAHEFGADC